MFPFQELAQHILQNSAVAIIFNLDLAIDSCNNLKFNAAAIFFPGSNFECFHRCEIVRKPADRELLFSCQTIGIGILTILEL